MSAWITVTVAGKAELVNMDKQERVYENEEGITTIEASGAKAGCIEVDQSVFEISRRLLVAQGRPACGCQ